MNKQNPTHDLLKIEIAESPKYAGSDWCAEMFDRWDPVEFKNPTLGTGLDTDPRIARSGVRAQGWLSLSDAGATGFFRKVSASEELRTELAKVDSMDALIQMAKNHGFDVTRESLTGMANAAYDKWKSGLTATVREFFDKALTNAKIRKELGSCRGPGEIIAVARKQGYEIADAELEPLHLKLNDLQESDSTELYGALLALRIVKSAR